MSVRDRGFASMDPEKRREIARAGGIAAHRKGTAHTWTKEAARLAGHKGGLAVHRKRHAAQLAGPCPEPASPPAPEPQEPQEQKG